MNRIKKIKVKVKEKPWQFFITMCGFLLLSVLICGSIFIQNLRVRSMSKEQQSVLMKETGALRDNMETEIHQLKEKLTQKQNDLTESEEILRELSASYSTTFERQLPGEMQKLTDHIATLKEEISTSQTTIQTIEKEMRENADGKGETLDAAVDEMTEIVQLIDKDLSGSLETIQGIIDSLKGRSDKEAEEMSAKLSEVEKKLSDKTESGVLETSRLLNGFVKEYTERQDNFTQQMDQQFSDQSSKMTENQKVLLSKVSDVKETLGNSLGDLQKDNEAVNLRLGDLAAGNQDINRNIGTLKDNSDSILGKLDAYHSDVGQMSEATKQELTSVEGKLDQVFQSVSNGKKILASALLTKGVELSEDATFEEIKNAILDVNQSLLLDGETLQGKIKYEYHYHHDGQENRVDDAMFPTAEGCFVVPVYHEHSGNALVGGGCYTEPVYHVHWGNKYVCRGCYTKVAGVFPDCEYEIRCTPDEVPGKCPNCTSTMLRDDRSYDPDNNTYRYYCLGENATKAVFYEPNCGREEGDIDRYEMNCGKQAGKSVEGYTPGCGMLHGQILKAVIDLDAGA